MLAIVIKITCDIHCIIKINWFIINMKEYSPLGPLPIFTQFKINHSKFQMSLLFFVKLQTDIYVFKSCQFTEHFAECSMITV